MTHPVEWYQRCCGVKASYLAKKEAAAEVAVGAAVGTAGVLQGDPVCDGEFVWAGECVLQRFNAASFPPSLEASEIIWEIWEETGDL